MIASELLSPVAHAVVDLVAAGTAEEQAGILGGRAELFCSWGADGALAVMCELSHGDMAFVSRLEAMRLSLDDVRRNQIGATEVVSALRRYLPFGGPGAPIRPAASDQPEFRTQVAAILWAYLTAEAWRVRNGIVEAFPAVFSESDLALDALAQLQAIPGSDQIPWLPDAADHLARVRAYRDVEQSRGLTGAVRAPSIRTRVRPMLTQDEFTELSLYEYQECRSAEVRAELLASNPMLISDRALEYCEMIAAHHRKRGATDTADSYDSVARSLQHARAGRLEEAAVLVRDIGYLPTDVQLGRLARAIATDDVRTAASLLRHSLHLVDRQLVPYHWATANAQLVRYLELPAAQDPGTSAVIGEEVIMRCLAALSVLDAGTKDWTDLCVTLAEQISRRSRGNRTENLEAATSILAEVAGADITTQETARAHLGLATAYCELFGDSATENLERAGDHAMRALETYEAAGNRRGASYARLALVQVLVGAAERVRGTSRGDLLDAAEMHLSQCDFPPVQAPSPSDRAETAVSHFARVVGLEEGTARSLLNARTATSLPPHLLVLQLVAVCKMLRYSDGTPDLDAHRAAVELHQRILNDTNRDADPVSWARTMYSLANMYTRYPEPTSAMLDRAEEAQRGALDAFQAVHADYEAGLVMMALGNAAFRRHHWAEAVSWLRKAALAFAEGETWSDSDRGVLAQVAELRETYARLSYAMYRSGHPARECLEWLERGKTRLAARHMTPFELREVTGAMPAGGALVVPLITSQGSLLWTVLRGPDSELTVTTTVFDGLTSSDFDAILHGSDGGPGWSLAYNAFLESRDGRTLDAWMVAIDQSCRALWELIGARVEASLRAASVAEGAPVVFAPPTHLSILPVHAAWRPSEDGGRHYLGDSYAITYTPGLRTLATAATGRQARTRAPASLLMIADPSGDLPHAAAEADAITGYFSDGRSKTLYGNAATRDEIAKHAPGRTHLHIACHGSFDSDNPSRSSLYLANGPIRLDELRKLTPLTEFDLVTLSACETGLLDSTRAPYEWLGIAGALIRSGATDIICTLWAIDDKATAKLMGAFYRSLIADGLAPAQALRAAQAKTRNEPDLWHPFYWAAFMHVGVARPAGLSSSRPLFGQLWSS